MQECHRKIVVSNLTPVPPAGQCTTYKFGWTRTNALMEAGRCLTFLRLLDGLRMTGADSLGAAVLGIEGMSLQSVSPLGRGGGLHDGIGGTRRLMDSIFVGSLLPVVCILCTHSLGDLARFNVRPLSDDLCASTFPLNVKQRSVWPTSNNGRNSFFFYSLSGR